MSFPSRLASFFLLTTSAIFFAFLSAFAFVRASFAWLPPQVLKAYESQGFEMLLQAFNDTKYLERLTGLDKLYDEGEAALESLDWDEDEDEGGDDDF